MVNVTNTSGKPLYRRLPSGQIVYWQVGESKVIESKRLLEELEATDSFSIGAVEGAAKVGGGIKTLSKPAKPKRKASRSKTQKKVDKALKKPKGLKKPKRAD